MDGLWTGSATAQRYVNDGYKEDTLDVNPQGLAPNTGRKGQAVGERSNPLSMDAAWHLMSWHSAGCRTQPPGWRRSPCVRVTPAPDSARHRPVLQESHHSTCGGRRLMMGQARFRFESQ